MDQGARDRQGSDDFSSPVERERTISPDRILSAIGDEHRRAILNALHSTSSKTLSYDALVERVADRIRDEETALEPDAHRQRVRIAMHHTHLPKLEAVRIIDYEADTGQIMYVGGELEQDLLALIESYDSDE
ncbi:hypothetical protein HTSR_0791 [Halodesulfurarchaeum formicicum]|uniref:DUF7344 domain-containing protein n=1 Tax=Halodesulfurarchaeum formicicum TaxID=1873524 RepID=A0A1D8S3N4_9EURY|nr:hypothetical protein HTSR_0791 [Halodesulfurarchaeum formicicum]